MSVYAKEGELLRVVKVYKQISLIHPWVCGTGEPDKSDELDGRNEKTDEAHSEEQQGVFYRLIGLDVRVCLPDNQVLFVPHCKLRASWDHSVTGVTFIHGKYQMSLR